MRREHNRKAETFERPSARDLKLREAQNCKMKIHVRCVMFRDWGDLYA
jgi:hypothetical protein